MTPKFKTRGASAFPFNTAYQDYGPVTEKTPEGLSPDQCVSRKVVDGLGADTVALETGCVRCVRSGKWETSSGLRAGLPFPGCGKLQGKRDPARFRRAGPAGNPQLSR